MQSLAAAAEMTETNPRHDTVEMPVTAQALIAAYGATMTLEQVAGVVRYSHGTLRQYLRRTAYQDMPLIKALKGARVNVSEHLFNTSKVAAFLDS